MKGKEIIKSSLKLSTILILLFGGVGMTVLSYYLLSPVLKAEYPDIAGLILGGFFGLLGLAALVSLLFLETLELDKEKLVVSSILKFPKKVIYLKDIVSYNEIEKENKSGRWHDLTVFTDRDKFKISSSIISNYAEFKRGLISGKPRNLPSEELWHSQTTRNFGIGFIAFGALLSFAFWNAYRKANTPVLQNELKTINVTVQNQLEIRRSKNSRSITINTIEYPNFHFELSGTTFNASKAEELVENIDRGNIIELDVTRDVYEKKLIKAKRLSFWDKYYNYSFIKIYGVRHNNQPYLTLNAYNQAHKSDSIAVWIFLLLSLGLTGLGVYFILHSKNILSTKDLLPEKKTTLH